MTYTEYKVVRVSEGGCSTLLFGSAPIPEEKLQAVFNQAVKERWQVVFQLVETQRFLLFWTRESVVITFGRS